MSRWERGYLGQERFPDTLSTMEIALQIGFLKMTGGTLNSVEIIPPGVLEHWGRQLGSAPLRIASIRALYRRRRTLFDHQAAALDALGRLPSHKR